MQDVQVGFNETLGEAVPTPMQILPFPVVMREPELNPKQLLQPPVHDNKLFTPTAALSKFVLQKIRHYYQQLCLL